MARLARIVMTGSPLHVTHWGNQRRPFFIGDRDRQLYLADLAVWAYDAGLAVWGYCLMDNHVHLVAVPDRPMALARAIGQMHQRHARRVNAAHGWTGHLWANRFYSATLDEAHLWSAIRYVELNPVRAGLVARAKEWPWSSAHAHVVGGFETGAPLLAPDRPFGGSRPHPLTGHLIGWGEWLSLADGEEEEAEAFDRLRQARRTGSPCSDEAFVDAVETRLGRTVGARKRGRKPKEEEKDDNQLELF